MAKPPRKPPRRPGSRKTTTSKTSTRPKVIPKPKAPKPLKPAPAPKAWKAFLAAHPTYWIGAFKRHSRVIGGLSASVQAVLKPIVRGQMASWSAIRGEELLVAFADKADFDAAKVHFRGATSSTNLPGAQGAFTVRL
jgi:hypothetical protein